MTTALTLIATLALGVLLGLAVGFLAVRRRRSPEVADVGPSLERLARQLDEVEALRRADQAGLRAEIGEHLRYVSLTADNLRRETSQLAAALSRSDTRGRWGEAQLRRIVESAGMLERVHFVEQDHRKDEDGHVRPDMTIDLGHGRTVVIDAKVPLAALLQAESCEDTGRREELLTQHARDVAAHAERLGSKDYWRRYDDAVEAVVMFMPAESMLAVALRHDPVLLERAFGRNVIIATPTTLLALLRTISHVWRREAVAENAAEVHRLGTELYDRLVTFADHVRRVGNSLDSAVAQYNKMVGSLDSRVLVSARRLSDAGVGHGELADMAPIERRTRATVTDAEPSLP